METVGVSNTVPIGPNWFIRESIGVIFGVTVSPNLRTYESWSKDVL